MFILMTNEDLQECWDQHLRILDMFAYQIIRKKLPGDYTTSCTAQLLWKKFENEKFQILRKFYNKKMYMYSEKLMNSFPVKKFLDYIVNNFLPIR